MKRTMLLTFIISFAAAYMSLESIFDYYRDLEEQKDVTQTAIIRDEMKERFKLFLDTPHSIGILAADALPLDKNLQNAYGPISRKLLESHKEILGLNLVNAQGVITHAYPAEHNQKAVGKNSQNYKQIKNSFEKGETYWLSAPFKLYQGRIGFVFYVPIVENKNLKGWFATVIAVDNFFEQFKAASFLESYDLIIKDKETDRAYFATALPPEEKKIYRSTDFIKGRKIVFESWSKHGHLDPVMTRVWSLLVGLIIAIGATIISRLIYLRRKAHEQLRNIKTILNLTAKEALAHLIDIHSELNLMGSTGFIRTDIIKKDVDYITNLIEQIDLLQTMSDNPNEDEVQINCLNVIQEQVVELREPLNKKEIKIEIDQGSMIGHWLKGNNWLFGNGIIRNLLTEAILIAENQATISISCAGGDQNYFLDLHLNKCYDTQNEIEGLNLNRRIEVIERTLKLYNGQLLVQRDTDNGIHFKIYLNR